MKNTERSVKKVSSPQNESKELDIIRKSPDDKISERKNNSFQANSKTDNSKQKVRSAIDEEKMQMIRNKKSRVNEDRLTDQQRRERIENMSFSHLYY